MLVSSLTYRDMGQRIITIVQVVNSKRNLNHQENKVVNYVDPLRIQVGHCYLGLIAFLHFAHRNHHVLSLKYLIKEEPTFKAISMTTFAYHLNFIKVSP